MPIYGTNAAAQSEAWKRRASRIDREEREAWANAAWVRTIAEDHMADPFKPGRLVAINGGPWPDEIYINDTGINPAKWAKLTNEERTFIPVELRPAGWDHVPGDPEI